MAKAPSIQFYPGDVQRDTPLNSVSLAAYGLWHRMMWVMFDGTPSGHLSVNGSVIPPVNLSLLLRVTVDELNTLTAELEGAGVFSRTDAGVIYCRRMVRDAKRRETNALNGGKGGNPNLKADKPSVGSSVNRKPNRISADAEAVSLNSGKERAKVHEAVLWPSFADFWDLYGKKRGRPNAEREWAKVAQRDREAIMQAVPVYVQATPVEFRKDPERYLKGRAWEDEVITRTTAGNGRHSTIEQKRQAVADIFAAEYAVEDAARGDEHEQRPGV